MKKLIPFLLLAATPVFAADIFVAADKGDDTADGSAEHPLKTISAAAEKAMPGDTVTVRAGVYRERVDPPRGGTDDAHRITYQAAKGEKVVITGSEPLKGWEKVSGDTWKVFIPNKFFGGFNPFAEQVSGDWFNPMGRAHHRGGVYLNDSWMTEAPDMAAVLKPAGPSPLWFAKVDGVSGGECLVNIASLQVEGKRIMAAGASARNGTQNAACSEGGQCVGFIRAGNWLRYDGVEFGANTGTIELRVASVNEASEIEIRANNAAGELLGTAGVSPTGDWQKWVSVSAKIKPTSGRQNICLVITTPHHDTDGTTIWAQFPGVNPNKANVEINVRPTVFTPKKTNIDNITVRGFKLRNAATNWAAPTAGQIGLVTAYWCKGWIIENNEIYNSRCCGIALGKYSDQWDGRRGSTEGYYRTIDDAVKKDGWSKEKIGSHIVRNNHIHHCGQTGIVGSLGCAFSTIEGNEIHDIHLNQPFGGAEMAGIKFHGAIDVVIKDNHIYRCGAYGGIWLDWMAQGARVTGNLLHDNMQDLFMEVNHGPFLVDGNLFLSGLTMAGREEGCYNESEGGVFAHNLIVGTIRPVFISGRKTPVMKPHGTEQVKLMSNSIGDIRGINNLLFAPGAGFCIYDCATLPCVMDGNVYAKGAKPSKFEKAPLVLAPGFDPGVKLVQKGNTWYLTFAENAAWGETKRAPVTTARLGKAMIPDQAFENPDGSSVKIDRDYFGKKRDLGNPFPGPFETPVNGEVKVWPK